MENWYVIVLAGVGLVGGRLLVNALKKRRATSEDYQEIARKNGWQYDKDTTSDRAGVFETFSEPNGDWTLKIIFINRGSSNTVRRVDWHTSVGALNEGEAVLGAPLPDKTVQMLQSGGALGSSLTKAAIKGTMYALGKSRFSLTLDEETAGHPGGIVLSSPGQETAMNSIRENPALEAFRATRKDIDFPVVIRDETGLTLRRPNITTDADELRAIVELGKALRQRL